MKTQKNNFKRWSQKDIEILKEQVTQYGVIKGGKTAAALLDRTVSSCTQKAYELKKKGLFDYKDSRKGMNPEIIAIIKECISNNPNNLLEAFRIAAKKTGLTPENIKQGWYSKTSRKSRDIIGPCFYMTGNESGAVNRKNQKTFVKSSVFSRLFNYLNKIFHLN